MADQHEKGSILVIVLVIVTIVFAATAAYFFIQNRQQKPQTVVTTTQPVNVTIPTPIHLLTQAQGVTASWKKISLNELTFKIPPTWSTRGDGPTVVHLSPVEFATVASDSIPPFEIVHRPNTTIQSVKNNLTGDDFIIQQEKPLVHESLTGTEIAGSVTRGPAQGSEVRLVIFAHNNDTYSFISYSFDETTDPVVFDQILSTFGFTQEQSQPTQITSERKISGIITAVENTLMTDGNCEVVVDNQRVIIQHSGERNQSMIPKEKGSLKGISCDSTKSLNEAVGKRLEAFGSWNGYSLTIEGKKDYYVEVK